MGGIVSRGLGHSAEHPEGRYGADEASEADRGDPGADDGGCITREGRRGPCPRGQVEGDHIDEGVQDLGGQIVQRCVSRVE